MNWLGIFSLIATIIIAIITIITISYRNRQHQINGFLDAFKILNNREDRSSRKKVYELNLEYEKNRFNNRPEVVDVRADFDVIGTLVKSRNIDEKLFLIEYG